MPRKSKSRSVQIVKGKALLGTSIATTAVGGTFQATRVEIDTSMCLPWSQLGDTFQKWRIKSLQFEYVPYLSSTVTGHVGMCILEDTDATTPTTMAEALGNRVSTLTQCWWKLRLHYRPKHVGWLFTKDGGISDDRFEMPGDFVVVTQGFTTAVTPGLIVVYYDLEFDLITNSSVSSKEKNTVAVTTISRGADRPFFTSLDGHDTSSLIKELEQRLRDNG